jgi:glycosyltransferase involved in cell wall biosynthesis
MNSTNYPFITIGIPTYKRPNRLKVLLESISAQEGLTDINWEVIVSDNCSEDNTAKVVFDFKSRISQLKYFCNEQNIGADNNIRSLIDKASGKFVWILPDDDGISDNMSLRNIINEIKSLYKEPSLIILNSAIVKLDSNEIIKPKTIPISGNIFIEFGLDVLKSLTDMDILAANKLILKREAFPRSFEQKHIGYNNTGPMAMALTAAAHGSVLIISKVYTIYGEGDSAYWRKKWGYIYFIEIVNLLKEAVEEIGLNRVYLVETIERKRAIPIATITSPFFFIFQQHKLKWKLLSDIYGWRWVLTNLLVSPFYIIANIKIIKYLKKKYDNTNS